MSSRRRARDDDKRGGGMSDGDVEETCEQDAQRDSMRRQSAESRSVHASGGALVGTRALRASNPDVGADAELAAADQQQAELATTGVRGLGDQCARCPVRVRLRPVRPARPRRSGRSLRGRAVPSTAVPRAVAPGHTPRTGPHAHAQAAAAGCAAAAGGDANCAARSPDTAAQPRSAGAPPSQLSLTLSQTVTDPNDTPHDREPTHHHRGLSIRL